LYIRKDLGDFSKINIPRVLFPKSILGSNNRVKEFKIDFGNGIFFPRNSLNLDKIFSSKYILAQV